MNPVALAVWLLVLGNLAASLSDVAVKMLQGEVVPFQYMFLRQFFAFALICIFRSIPISHFGIIRSPI
ncbi:hypothetical protein BFX28_12485, partial [Vibrio cholerae]